MPEATELAGAATSEDPAVGLAAVASLRVLLESLEKFTGTVVFVSHDRYFIDKLATRIFEVADGAVHVFPGNYEDYRWRKENASAAATPSHASVDMRDAAAESAPSNGGYPASDSYSRMPIAYTSLRPSMSFPIACSGDM